MPPSNTVPLNIFQTLPKVDLHRHLEGSLRLTTMLDIASDHGVTIPPGVINLAGLVQVQEQDPLTFSNFLEKFKTLRLFYRSDDVIDRITREAVEDAARDGVRYLELRFTPVALGRVEGFPLRDVMDWVFIEFLKWGQKAFRNFRVVPPMTGIVHQVNLGIPRHGCRPAALEGSDQVLVPRCPRRHEYAHDDDKRRRHRGLGRWRYRGGGGNAWPAG